MAAEESDGVGVREVVRARGIDWQSGNGWQFDYSNQEVSFLV